MLRILDITSPDINNGLGCRVTVWVSGCKHHCAGCHNRWTWNYENGSEMNEAEFHNLYDRLAKDYIQGITISGGDPLCQDVDGLEELFHLLEWFREVFPNKDVWLYTGYKIEDILPDEDKMNIVRLCDIIVDGKYEKDKRDLTLAFRGSTNQRIIDVKKYVNGESDYVLNSVLD